MRSLEHSQEEIQQHNAKARSTWHTDSGVLTERRRWMCAPGEDVTRALSLTYALGRQLYDGGDVIVALDALYVGKGVAIILVIVHLELREGEVQHRH